LFDSFDDASRRSVADAALLYLMRADQVHPSDALRSLCVLESVSSTELLLRTFLRHRFDAWGCSATRGTRFSVPLCPKQW